MIYFDNSSTTKPKKEVNDFVYENNLINYGNPSSLHHLGIESEKIIKATKKVVAEIIKARQDEIYFTSGGTEANNMAIIGTALRNQKKGRHIITTQIEHAAVLNAYKYLETLGFETTYIKPDRNGFIDPKVIETSLREDTILVSVMHVNNEIGSVQDIEAIGNIIKSRDHIRFHVDAVQSYGKLPIDVNRCKIDLLSLSGHKIHAFKGIGALYIRKGVKLTSLFYGGQQEEGIRPGTENLPGILSLLKASEIAKKGSREYYQRVKEINDYLLSQLENLDGIKINSHAENGVYSPYILNVSFEGLKGEVLLHTLEQRGLYVSTGSACNSKKKTVSHVLQAIDLSPKFSDGTLRLSFSALNTMDEAVESFNIIKESLNFLNSIMKRR